MADAPPCRFIGWARAAAWLDPSRAPAFVEPPRGQAGAPEPSPEALTAFERGERLRGGS